MRSRMPGTPPAGGAELRERLLQSVGSNAGNDSGGPETPSSRQAKVSHNRTLPTARQFACEANSMPIEAHLNIAEIPYESGAIRFRYARVMAPDRTHWIRHGLFVEYHENGTVISEGQYAAGKEDGLWRDFHPNGQLASEGCYRAGKEVGVWRFWNPAGIEEPSTDFN